MPDIAVLVAGLGGMAQKQQLVSRGARDLDLTRAVRSGRVKRVRNGWYSTLRDTDAAFRAVRVGGRLTGISAIIARGGWVLGIRPLHVSVPVNAARLRTQSNRHRRLRMDAKNGVVLHWDAFEVSETGSSTMVGLSDALLQVALDESFETAVAAFDWALHCGEMDRIDLEAILLRLPEHLRLIGDWVDADCESLPESLARTRLRLSGHRVVSQVPVGEDERIDLVIDEVVAVEVDGERWHLNRFEEDRAKDVTITLESLHALRPSARMVFDNWERFERAVELALTERGRSSVENSGMPMPAHRRIRLNARIGTKPRRVIPEFPKGTQVAVHAVRRGGNIASRARLLLE